MRFIKVVLLCCVPWFSHAEEAPPQATATDAINPFGLELCRQLSKRGGNVAISPYSLQNALAMAYAGAAGETKAQMAKVLRYPEKSDSLLESMFELNSALHALNHPPDKKPALVSTAVANRLFVDNGFTLKAGYLEPLEKIFRLPVTVVDLQSPGIAELINKWVSQETKGKIANMLPAAVFDERTRMFLVNAFYLKAPWEKRFSAKDTKPRPFYSGPDVIQVPTMRGEITSGYLKTPLFTAAGIPMATPDLQLLILLPPSPSGLPAMEAKLTPEVLLECAKLTQKQVLLSLPKLKLQQPVLTIGAVLAEMGMTEAFDIPPGTANFEVMADRTPESYLFLSNVYHQVFFEANEEGVEAAAATADTGGLGGEPPAPPEKVVLNIDRPFFFAIQHKPSGACLVMGRIEKP